MSEEKQRNNSIVVVSGLPRSGTSMMMRMLEAGGIPVLSDHQRTADDDNPRGYYELEAVKQSQRDASWLEGAPGHAVKVISRLLPDLPADRRYKVIFVRRDLDEVLASQREMLRRRGEPMGAGDQELKEQFVAHLAEIEAWLGQNDRFDVLYVNYNRTLADPVATSQRINRFLGGWLDVAKMSSAVEPDLYRNRRRPS